jgi:hypothetical protein
MKERSIKGNSRVQDYLFNAWILIPVLVYFNLINTVCAKHTYEG